MDMLNRLQRDDSQFTANLATDLLSFVGTLEQAFMDNAVLPSNRDSEMKPGEIRTYPELPHWTFERLSTAELKVKPKSQPYRLECTPYQVERLKKELAANNLPNLSAKKEAPGLEYLRKLGITPESDKQQSAGVSWLPVPDFKGHIRLSFNSKQEAWDYAQDRSPQRLRRGVIVSEIPADVMAVAVELVLLMLNHPEGRDLDPRLILQEALDRKSTIVRSCTELAYKYLGSEEPEFDPNHPKRHRQFPDGWRRQRAHIIYDFTDFFKDRDVSDINDALVNDFITFVIHRRLEKYKRDGNLARATVLKNLHSISAMFVLGMARYRVRYNPFYKFHVWVKRRGLRVRGTVKPHSIEQIISLLVTAWKMDKQICLAIILSSLCGLRRGEILKTRNSAIDLIRGAVSVTSEAAKKDPDGTGRGRPIYAIPCAIAWLMKFELGAPDDLLLGGMSEDEYDARLKAVRVACHLGDPENWPKDMLRKNHSIYLQWMGLPMESQQQILGHVLKSHTTRKSYHGDGTPEWAHAILRLFPHAVLGTDPEVCSLAERFLPWVKPSRKAAKP